MRRFTSYTKVQIAIGAMLRGRHVRRLDPPRRLLNVGCGPEANPAFVNLDYHWTPDIDVCWDIVKKPYPFADGAFDGIYTEHCLEHIPFESFRANCREFFRLLAPGGTVRIIMPDGEIYLDIYQERKMGGTRRMPYEESYPTPMARINGLFRNHGHLFIYDFETVRVVLESCGFVAITKESFGKGRNPSLLIDTERRAFESLYVEAVKP